MKKFIFRWLKKRGGSGSGSVGRWYESVSKCYGSGTLLQESLRKDDIKGIVQPFELGGVTSLIRSAVRFSKAGHFQKKILMIQSHERSLKHNSAA